MERLRSEGARKGLIIAVGVAALALLGGWIAFRTFVRGQMEARLFRPAPAGSSTPAEIGLPHQELRFVSGDRELVAWLVRAPDTATITTAMLLFHGNGVSISDQINLQRRLFEENVTSMAFDYSGFGRSTGTPTTRRLREDAIHAHRVFSDSVGLTARKFLMGTSLGAAVMLSAIDEIQDNIDGVIAVGTFASSREVGVRRGQIPSFVAWLVPNLFDNVAAAANLQKPLLVIHSEADELFPLSDAERLVQAAGGPSRLVATPSGAHATYLTTVEQWRPVLEFVRMPQ